jgi:hypothetical protein
MKKQRCHFRFASPLRAGLVIAAFALAGSFLAPPAAAKVHLKISACAEVTDAFENWTAATPWEQIKNYRNGNASRPVVDLLLELQALKAGGLDFDFELVRKLTYELAKIEVIEGRAELTAETIWNDEIARNANALLKTDEIIRTGEFVKGIYVLPTNARLLKINSLDELRDSVVAVVATWALDVKTMDEMKLKGIVKAIRPELVFSMIQKQQADFTLSEFSASPDMGIVSGGTKLVPVPNCKVAILGSRSWVVSKASPQADEILSALTNGVKILRENGTIERAYQESGFFNPRVADWKRLF